MRGKLIPGLFAVGSLIVVVFAPAKASGQEEDTSAAVNAANDPLANMIAINFQTYYAPDLAGVDGSSNAFLLRAITPFWRIIPRFTLPVVTAPTGDPAEPSQSGLGDFNAFAAVEILKEPFQLGIGPLYVAPTATSDLLGADKHQLGGALVAIVTRGVSLMGMLVTYQHSVAGDGPQDVSLLNVQPFANFQIGAGFYLRTTGVWAFDFENDTYNVPLGVGVGKVVVLERVVLNLFIEPQYTVLHEGVGQPLFQIFSGINFQFVTGGGGAAEPPPPSTPSPPRATLMGNGARPHGL